MGLLRSKRKGKKYDVEMLEQLVVSNKTIEFAGSGDPHEEFGKVRLLFKNIDSCDLDFLLFDGDYLAEPAYLRTKLEPQAVRSESMGRLKELFAQFESCSARSLCVAGNYELPGTAGEAIEEMGNPEIVDLGADRSKAPHEIKVHSDSQFMEIYTGRTTWPGKVIQEKGFTFVGVEGSNPINYTFPGERTEEDIEWALRTPLSGRNVDSQDLIVVTHAPPFGMRDRLGKFGVPQHMWGAQKGSAALRRFADSEWPFMIVVGHIHEAFGLHIRARPKNSNEEAGEVLEDLSFGSRTKVLVAYDTAKTEVSMTLNKGTLELWNWSRVRVAQSGTVRLVDIEAEWLDRKGRKKPFKKYNKVIELDDAISAIQA